MSGRFVVEIDRLVVDGVADSERGLVARGLQRELELLVAERGLPEGLAAGEIPVLDADLDVGSNEPAAVVGASAARALYGALSG